jgi:hypothetical protein
MVSPLAASLLNVARVVSVAPTSLLATKTFNFVF